ncbi:hypothetical protein GETHLI_13290 [Geothrix limicola]|uniref:Uncharacterized protein n=1 Tax=Geothrix limicola TaxID=2927978 RepID=A0ABQ5QDW4_9BACT|nr:hypothetical protein [Geothrix limicola]GLH72827.1 hypothetical protein GETHLI_13290 [Geothrix limicola]
MKKVVLSVLFAGALAHVPLLAETVRMAPGSFEVPSHVQVLDRKEDVHPALGQVEGMIVFGPKDDLPRAVFIVSYTTEKNAAQPKDLLDAAVKVGNPFTPTLSSKDAQLISFGGVQAGTYFGTLPNGLVARSYVVSHNGYRVVALLKGPSSLPYKKLMDAFSAGLEHFQWAAPPAPGAGSIQLPSSDKPSTPRQDAPGSSSPNPPDQEVLLGLLAGDLPITPDHLQTYLRIALAQPNPPGLVQPGQELNGRMGSLSLLVFSGKEKHKSLEFWTSIRGGDYLKGVLKKHGIVIDKFMSSTILSGEPKKELVPAITAEVASWYSTKLRDRAP